jgi:hypothetical protein
MNGHKSDETHFKVLMKSDDNPYFCASQRLIGLGFLFSALTSQQSADLR